MSEKYSQIISLEGYILYKKKFNKKLINEFKKELTISPINENQFVSKKIKNYIETDEQLIIPLNYAINKLNNENVKILKYIKTPQEISVKFNGKLKDEQLVPYNKLLNHIKDKDRGIFSASTGVGKTILSLKLISDMKLKTLIISASVNQVDLLKQWKDKINIFLPYTNIGLIRGPVIDCKNKDIILSTVSTLSRKEFNSDIFKDIGMVIIDECFVPWQKIKTTDGVLSIYNIYLNFLDKKKIYTKAYDINNKKVVDRLITNVFCKKNTKGLVRIELSNNHIDCTPNHKFLLLNGTWKTAENLEKSDMFLFIKDNLEIDTISFKNKYSYDVNGLVYDLEVENEHNYILDSGLVAHNCHHMSSDKNSKILFKLGGIKKILGLSATPERPDGLTQILKWWIGDIFYSFKRVNNGLKSHVLKFELNTKEYKEFYTENGYKRQICYTKMINNLTNIEKRNNFIIDIIFFLAKNKRQILLVSERIEHVQILGEILKKRKPKFSYSLYIGTHMNEKEKEEAKKSQVIIATIQSFGEGIDEERLNTIILSTPKKYIKEDINKKKGPTISFPQLIGRIFRKEHTDFNPLIIDLWDKFSIFNNQGYSRQRYYNDELKNCKIKKVSLNIDEYKKLNDKWFDIDNFIETKKENIMEKLILFDDNE